MSDLFLRLDWASARGRDQQSLIEDEFRAERASSLGMAGLRDWPSVARQYRIPRSVLLRMGAAPSKCGPDPRR